MSGMPPEYEDVGHPRCDVCRQTSLQFYAGFYHCAEHSYDLCQLCALVSTDQLRKDANGRFPVRGHACPLVHEPNSERGADGHSCDGAELQGPNGRCQSTSTHNLANGNQQFLYCEPCNIDVCIPCALSLQI